MTADLIAETLAMIYGPNRERYETAAAQRGITIHQLAAAALAERLARDAIQTAGDNVWRMTDPQ